MRRDTANARLQKHRREYPFALVTATLVLVAFADTTFGIVVPVSLAGIGRLFHVTAGSLAWVLSVQLVAIGVCTPVFSRLGDIHGHRRILRAAAVATAAGGVLTAVAPNFGLLLTGQALQGPAGAIVPLAIGVLRDQADGTRLRRGIAAILTGQASAGAVGLLAAAQLYRSTGSVRDVLWIPGGCALLAAVASFTFVPEARRRVMLRMDWLGALSLSSGIGLLLLGLALGPGSGWSSARTIGALALGVVLLGIWAAIELRVSDPLFDLRAMSQRAVAPMYMAALFIGAGAGVVAANVTFASAPRKVTGFGFGLDITGIALIGLSPTIAIVAGAVTAPRLVRLIGHERTIVTGCLIGFAGATAQAVWHYALWQWVIVIGVAAAGVGLIASAMSMALAERTDPTSTGIALGMLATVRAVGGSVASAGAGAILNSAISAETHFPREWAYVTVWFVIGGLTSLIAVPIVALSRLPAGPPTRPAP